MKLCCHKFGGPCIQQEYSIGQPDTATTDNEYLIVNVCQRILEASIDHIRQFIGCKYYPKPQWNEKLKEYKRAREILYQRYRYNRTMRNLLQWKKIAEYKKRVKTS